MRPSARAGTLVALLTVAAAGFACRDITAPTPVPARQSTLLNPVGRVVVTRDSMRGWMFYDDQHDTACVSSDACQLVQGPTGQPGGTGSAELAAPSSADGKAIILPDYRGTRLDQITDLRYSTYRQTADPGNNIAIALQINVDYDLTDQSTGYQGRLVFEPYQGVGGNVTQGNWQSWDAKAGRWWGTRSSVTRNNGAVANPCVQSTPCTWTQLLAAFPDAGVHATYGAIVLKAGSGWTGFRGNVDELSIGVGNAITTFDFEGPPVAARLRTRIGDGVLGARLAADSEYAIGATVTYAFSAAPGHDGPWVVLDDTIAAASGTITMDKAHSLEVESDTIYTIAGLSEDGKEISRKITQLLTVSDKARVYGDMMRFMIHRIDEGADQQKLERDNALAWYLTFDPVRDATAMATVDAALRGYTFSIYWYGADNYYDLYWSAPSPPSGPAPSRAPSLSRAPTPSRRRSVGVSTGPTRSVIPADQVDSPREPTTFVYVNGIWTDPGQPDQNTGAYSTVAKIVRLVQGMPRFQGSWAHVDHVYNKTSSVQLKEFDEAYPCVAPGVRNVLFRGAIFSAIAYASCKGEHFVKAITTRDLVEAATARLQLLVHLPPTNPQVEEIATEAKQLRDAGSHVIFIGHSEGTLLIAQAIRSMPRPIQVAATCVASLSLASPGDRGTFDLDDPYKLGFIIKDDVILETHPTGWELVSTEASTEAEARIAAAGGGGDLVGALAEVFRSGTSIHGIDATYLRDSTSVGLIRDRITQLHKECVQQELTLTPSKQTVTAGSEFTVTPHVYNQNGRELLGRITYQAGPAELPAVTPPVPYRYLARTPRDTMEAILSFGVATNVLFESARVDVPLVPITGVSFAERDSSWWELVGASNAGLGDPPYGWEQGPSDQWDGGENSCGRTETILGRAGPAGPSYGVFLLHCMRTYTVSQGTVSDPGVAAQVKLLYTGFGSAPGYSANGGVCGPEHCVAYVVVNAVDSLGMRVATSGPVIVAGPPPLASRQPSTPRPHPSSAPGIGVTVTLPRQEAP